MTNTTRYTILKIAVACLSSCFFMTSCENDVDAVKALGARVIGIDVGKDVAIYISNDGKLGSKLTSPLMNRYLEDSSKMIEFPLSIHVDFYKDSNQVESQLSAKYAKYKETEKFSYPLNVSSHEYFCGNIKFICVPKNNLEGLMDIKTINNYLFFYSNTNQIIKKIEKETADILYKREKFSVK